MGGKGTEESSLAYGTVFLVDDDESVLRAISRLVRSEGLKVAAFSSPKKFLETQRRDDAGCVVLDLSMPELGGLDLQAALAKAGNPLPIIFLTGEADVPTSVRAMKSGAVDFLCKPCGDDELLAAIRVALSRDRKARLERAEKRSISILLESLTPREYEVMLGVVAGKMNKQIAADLGIAEKTVKVHRGRVMAKLEVDSVPDLVRLSERGGIRPSAWD